MTNAEKKAKEKAYQQWLKDIKELNISFHPSNKAMFNGSWNLHRIDIAIEEYREQVIKLLLEIETKSKKETEFKLRAIEEIRKRFGGKE